MPCDVAACTYRVEPRPAKNNRLGLYTVCKHSLTAIFPLRRSTLEPSPTT